MSHTTRLISGEKDPVKITAAINQIAEKVDKGGVGGSSDLDVFLCIGDSNVVGEGSSASSVIIQPGTVKMYASDGSISDANDPTKTAFSQGQNANTGSAWPAFGSAYYAATGIKVGLVICGVDGSTQNSTADLGDGNWDTGGTLFAAAVTAATTALTAFSANGFTATLRGVIVNLGANDGLQIDNSVITQGQYQTSLASMLAAIRTSFGASFPVYLIQTGTSLSASDTGYSQVRAAQIAVVAADPYTQLAFFNTFDFLARSMMSSGAHYTQAGYNEVGAVTAANIVSAESKNGLQANSWHRYWTQGNVSIGYAGTPDTILKVSTNTSAPPSTPFSGPHFSAADSAVGGWHVDTFGAVPASTFRRANGTNASKSTLPASTPIGGIVAAGYDGSAYSGTQASVRFITSAGGAWSGSNHGTDISFQTTPFSSTAGAFLHWLWGSGGISVGQTQDPGFAGGVNLKPQAFASLPAASSALEGTLAAVTNSSTATFGATITGGGTNHVLAYCNGTNWIVA